MKLSGIEKKIDRRTKHFLATIAFNNVCGMYNRSSKISFTCRYIVIISVCFLVSF